MSIREELILKVLARESTVVELAEEYDVSRKTVYKWLARYQEHGLAGLVDEHKRPLNSPMKTSPEFALEIIQVRKEHRRWGPKKIAAILARRHPDASTPSLSTISLVLNDAGLAQRRCRRTSGGLPPTPPGFIPTEPNDLWTSGTAAARSHATGRSRERDDHADREQRPRRPRAPRP